MSALIFAGYYFIKYMCALFPPPYYYPSIHISPAAVAVFTVLIDVYLLLIGVRNERRGIRTTFDETMLDSEIIPSDCQNQ